MNKKLLVDRDTIIILKEISKRLSSQRRYCKYYLDCVEATGDNSAYRLSKKLMDIRIKRLDNEIKEIGKCILKLRGDKWRI